MAVQVPTLQRLAPSAPASAGRIETTVADTSVASQAMNKGIGQVLETSYKAFEAMDENAANLAGTRAGLEFGTRYKVELGKLEKLKGDPTEAYAKFDQDSTDWENEINEKYKGASSRVRAAVQDRMNKTKWELADRRQLAQATQYGKYDQETTDASVKLKIDNALVGIETLDASTPENFRSSVVPLQMQINGIKDDRIGKGKRDGLVRIDADGNETYAPQLREQIRKDISEVIENSIKTLNAVGKTNEAKALMDEYGDQLTAKSRVDLTKGTKDSKITNDSLMLATQFYNLPPDVAMARLEKTNADPEVKEKAQANLSTHFKRLDDMKDLRAKQNYESAATYIGKSKFTDVNDLENDEIFKRLSPGMTEKQREALRQMVEAPKSSDDNVKSKAYDKLFDGSFTGMSYADLKDQTRGLNKEDAGMFEKAWKTANDDTQVEKRQQTTYMGTQLRMQMQEAGLIRKNSYGRYENKDEIAYTRASNKLMDVLNTLPKNASMADQNKFVREFVQRDLLGKVFEPAPTAPKLQSSPSTPQGSALKAVPPPQPLTQDQTSKFMADFARDNGRNWSSRNPDDMKAYNAFKARGGK